MKQIIFLAGLFYTVAFLPFRGVVPGAWAETVSGFPTGLLELEKKYPYYLYVPAEYTTDQLWPLIVLIGKRGELARDLASAWSDWAKKNQSLLLVVPNTTPQGDVPQKSDEWLFSIKREVMERYRVDPNRILLVGLDSGGHYAAYLGTNHPEEFSAAALIRASWAGPFERILRPTPNRQKQISFYLALDPEGEHFSKAEARALEFEKKGYQVTFEPYKHDEALSQFQDRLFQWFQADTEARVTPKQKHRATFKEKWNGFFHDFFEV